MRLFMAVSFCFIAAAQPAWADDDPAASFLTQAFAEACIPNMGRPADVKKWADDKHLGKIENQTALAVFVGAGGKGGAWVLPSAYGNFALSIRGASEGCAVWARTANPAVVEKFFKQIVEGVKRPEMNIRVDQDSTLSNPSFGQVRSLAYYVAGVGKPSGLEFILHTTEKPGGPFQASLEVSIVADHNGLSSPQLRGIDQPR
jgi:hypothetical protein